MIDKVREQTG